MLEIKLYTNAAGLRHYAFEQIHEKITNDTYEEIEWNTIHAPHTKEPIAIFRSNFRSREEDHYESTKPAKDGRV